MIEMEKNAGSVIIVKFMVWKNKRGDVMLLFAEGEIWGSSEKRYNGFKLPYIRCDAFLSTRPCNPALTIAVCYI